jgi:hypothetical protein
MGSCRDAGYVASHPLPGACVGRRAAKRRRATRGRIFSEWVVDGSVFLVQADGRAAQRAMPGAGGSGSERGAQRMGERQRDGVTDSFGADGLCGCDPRGRSGCALFWAWRWRLRQNTDWTKTA